MLFINHEDHEELLIRLMDSCAQFLDDNGIRYSSGLSIEESEHCYIILSSAQIDELWFADKRSELKERQRKIIERYLNEHEEPNAPRQSFRILEEIKANPDYYIPYYYKLYCAV